MTDEPTTRYACPVCGTVHVMQSERYRNHACHDCEKRARCSHDRSVIGYNTSPFGGFEAHHYDRGDNRCDQVTGNGMVTIDGLPFRMREARFGGTVCTPLAGVVPVAQTVVWSRHGPIEWTSAGNPEPFVGYVSKRRRRRGLFMRSVTTWEWMVRKVDPDAPDRLDIVKHGAAHTPQAAKDRVVEFLDHMNILLHEND